MTFRARVRARAAGVAALVTALALSGAACSSTTSGKGDTSATPGGSSARSTTPGRTISGGAPPTKTGSPGGPCTYTAAGKAARDVGRPPSTPVAASTLSLLLEVAGATAPLITIALSPSTAPCTVNSIAFLARAGYFDATKCHRLTTSGIYVLQCGDPTGTGSGGPGYKFADELSGKETYPAGTVAMANAGPGTNGSQFFLVYKNSDLPPSYTVFGRITAGLATVTGIAANGENNANGAGDGAPKQPVVIAKATST